VITVLGYFMKQPPVHLHSPLKCINSPVYVLLVWHYSVTSLKHLVGDHTAFLLGPGSSSCVCSTCVNDLLGVTTECMNLG